MEKLEKVQSVAELTTQIRSLDASQRKLEINVSIILDDMNFSEREAFEEAMFQSIIEASLVEADDDIIETDLRVAAFCPKPMYDVDEQLFAAQSDTTYEDKLRQFNAIYIGPKSVSIAMMNNHLEAQKKMMFSKEHLRV